VRNRKLTITKLTHKLGGIALSNCQPFATGTVVAHTAHVARPVPYLGIIRGKGETAADIDTASEALGIIQDVTLIDYSATGASDGGELYTIKTTVTAADTSGLEIVNVNVAQGTVDVNVDARSYRHDVT